MSFKDYLISKRNIIIVLMCINSFALIVNVLGIKGVIEDSVCPDYISHNVLTDGGTSVYGMDTKKENFWPFVKFLEPSESAFYCGGGPRNELKGIFRYFDISEFFVYSSLIILGFYIVWESKRKSK